MEALNYQLACYLHIAYNNPKKFPKKPFFQEQQEELQPMTDEEMERQARRNTIKMGGVINDIRRN